MARSEPYPAPPIIDAIVELRLKSPLAERHFQRVVKAFSKSYDRHEELGEIDIQVRVEPGKVEPSVSEPRPVHVFSNSDRSQLDKASTRA